MSSGASNWTALFFLIPFLAPVPGAVAQSGAVDVALIFAVDVSDSIDGDEVKLQRQGYIEAMGHPRILHAIKKGKLRRIAVAYFEWADAGKQNLIVDWTIVKDEASARAFGAKLTASRVAKGHFTSISSAISFAFALFDRNPYQGRRRVIDISGDGRNNRGPPLGPMRDAALGKRITINGLPIVNDRDEANFGRPPGHIERYYRQEVIAGANAFVVVAKNFGDFGDAISRKLIREIAGGYPRSGEVHASIR